MGHFGRFDDGKSETVDEMICRPESASGYNICKNINDLINILRYFFNYQTTKDNFGMMLDVEWSYNWRNNGMTLKSARV